MIAFATLSGTYSPNNYFYKPDYGSFGTEEWEEFNDCLDTADTQIEANKIMGEASVDTSGTPEANDISRFTDENTIEGLSYAELKAALDLEINTDIQAHSSSLDDFVTWAGGGWNIGRVITYSGAEGEPSYPDIQVFSDLTDMFVIHERGGLEADISAYDGLIKVSGGATSNLTIGISNNNIVEVDDADAANGNYARFTANGLEGRTIANMFTDMSIDDQLQNLTATEIAELEAIGDTTISSDQWGYLGAMGGQPLESESDPNVDTQGEIEAILTYALDDTAGNGDTDKLWSADKIYDQLALKITDTANAIDSDHYTDSSIDHEHLAPDVISGMTDVTSADADYMLIWDATDSALKKVDMGEVRGAGGGASELSDLSDVHTSTPTDKYVLIADGVDFESRQLTSDDLSDKASIAMLDEEEAVSNLWIYLNGLIMQSVTDSNELDMLSKLSFDRHRDGDPTSSVSDDDILGQIDFWAEGSYLGAIIRAVVDGTPGVDDMPTRLEFLTSPDDSATPTLRMAIDNAGNIKMGDGAWTNYVNVTNAGVLSLEGTANIEGIDATEAGYLATVTSNVQDQLDGKGDMNDVVDDTTPELGGNMELNEHNLDVSSALSSDHTYSGDIDYITAGESVVFGDVLYHKWADHEYYKAKADAAATAEAEVIALESKGDGQSCKVLRRGYIRDDSWNFSSCKVFLDTATAGLATNTVPSTSGHQVKAVGRAFHADKIYFNVSVDIGEVK